MDLLQLMLQEKQPSVEPSVPSVEVLLALPCFLLLVFGFLFGMVEKVFFKKTPLDKHAFAREVVCFCWCRFSEANTSLRIITFRKSSKDIT